MLKRPMIGMYMTGHANGLLYTMAMVNQMQPLATTTDNAEGVMSLG